MGDCSYYFAILYDWASGCALHYTTGKLYQPFVRHLKLHSLVGICRFFVYICYFQIIFFQFSRYFRYHLGTACVYLILAGNRIIRILCGIFRQFITVKLSVNSHITIAVKCAYMAFFAKIHHSAYLSRRACLSLFDFGKLHAVQITAVCIQEIATLCSVSYSMSQRTKTTVLCIISDSTDSRQIILHPYSHVVSAIIHPDRRNIR